MSPVFYEDSVGAKLTEKVTKRLDEIKAVEDAYIDDPAALEAAEQAAQAVDATPDYSIVTDEWVRVFGPSKVSGLLDVAGTNAAMITMPLDAEGIAYCWDPYRPDDMPGAATPAEHAVDMPFSLRVAPADADHARELLTATYSGSKRLSGAPATHELSHDARINRQVLAGSALLLFLTPILGSIAAAVAFPIRKLLRRDR